MFSTEQLRLSPVHGRLQLTVVHSEPGIAVLSMPLTDDIKGIYEGTVHGGMLATFADAACASCLWGTYDFGPQLTVTTDIHVRYYRQPKGGPLIAEAKMVHKGRRLLSAECVVIDAAERILIRSTATFMLVEAGDQPRVTHPHKRDQERRFDWRTRDQWEALAALPNPAAHECLTSRSAGSSIMAG